MIPKLIHYCWFGNNKKSALVSKCINSWKEYMPDYRIVEWNQHNFDINANDYVCDAYKERKYAFVSDYARLYVLKKYGGIYFDTDTEVVKCFDDFLGYSAFIGFADADEVNDRWELNTACIGSEANNSWIDYLIKYYEDAKFIKRDGTYNTTTNSKIITDMSKEFFSRVNVQQTLSIGEVELFPRDYFDPVHPTDDGGMITSNTYAIHWHDCTWGRPYNNYDRVMGVINRSKNIVKSTINNILLTGFRKE